MSREERIDALAGFGFTARQAAFLDTVLHVSGVCLPRQYAACADVAYGHTVTRFFERLVGRGFASACQCLHNRGLVYHVHHRGLYAAIGQPQSRLRRPVPAAAVTPRLMLLDAVLDAPEVTWLRGEREKVEHFSGRLGVPVECLPQQAARTAGRASLRLFPDALPIGIEWPNGAVIVYPATRTSLADFRPFLRRHLAFLSALPAWVLGLVFAPDERLVEAAWNAAVDREIGPLFGPPTHVERRVEWRALGHRYGHLSPLVAAAGCTRLGVEPGEHWGDGRPARAQPPWARPPRQHHRALGGAATSTCGPNHHWPCVL